MQESWKMTKCIFWLQKVVKIKIWWHFQIRDPKFVYISFLLLVEDVRFIPLVGGGKCSVILVRVYPPPGWNKDFSAHLTWYAEKLLRSTWSWLVDLSTPNHSKRHFENCDFRVDFRLFHEARFLPRHFFLRVVWPRIDVRYIPPDLGNVLEAYKKLFRHLKKFWGRLEVEWSTSVHPTSQNVTLKIVILESIFDFSMGLGFCRAIFFLRVVWPWIDVRYIPLDLGNVLEVYKNFFRHLKTFWGRLQMILL